MKRRIVACILAAAMLLTSVVPVAAEGDNWRNSSFQKTIDWLFGHSNEIGYAEISAAAAEMKQDYTVLRENSVDDETGAGLIRVLDAYVRARSENSDGDGSLMEAAVRNSHQKLWKYFQGSVRTCGGNVVKVQPVLQVRNVRTAEEEITLSVYEWVYMTYEIDGRKDISGHGFDHRMVFRVRDGRWILVQDLWDTGEGDSFVPEEPESVEKPPVDDSADSPEDQSGKETPDAGGDDGSLTDEKDVPQGDESADQTADSVIDNIPQEDKGSEGNGADEDLPQESSDPSEGESSSDSDVTDEDKPLDGDKPSDESRTEENTDPEMGSDREENHVPKTDTEEEPAPVDPVSAEDTAAGDDTYIRDLPQDHTVSDAESQNTILFHELNTRKDKEPEGLFAAAQEQIARSLTPFSTAFGIRTMNYTYSYQDAVAYADKYATSYNPAYPNYNSIGGDCANFVSQCLYAGGLPMTDGWFFRDSNNRSSSWSLADGLFKYLSASCGTAVENPADSDVTAGNPVFYYSAGKGRYSHTAICVGVNASGVPVVDAHNNDHLRAVWTLGSGWSKRTVVKINGNGAGAGTVAPPLPPEEIGGSELWRVTAGSGLKIRKDAGTSYASLGAIPKNQQISIVEKKTVGQQTWGKTTYKGVTGWCCLIYSPQVSYATFVSGSLDGVVATGIKLDRTTATISGIGNTVQLNATVTPSGASPHLVWTCSNLSIATVNNGLVKALSKGEVVITVQTADGSDKTASCIVEIVGDSAYTVKYNLNGGKNNRKNLSRYDSSKGMTLYNPTRKGYVFGGWYTKKNLTGKITKIAKGKTKNYTLYAKWVKLAKPALRKMTRVGSGKIRVYIKKKVAKATGYQIQYARNAGFTKGVKTKRTTSLSPTLTGLKRRTRYYVRVRPYIKIASGNYVYGSYSGYRYITVS